MCGQLQPRPANVAHVARDLAPVRVDFVLHPTLRARLFTSYMTVRIVHRSDLHSIDGQNPRAGDAARVAVLLKLLEVPASTRPIVAPLCKRLETRICKPPAASRRIVSTCNALRSPATNHTQPRMRNRATAWRLAWLCPLGGLRGCWTGRCDLRVQQLVICTCFVLRS